MLDFDPLAALPPVRIRTLDRGTQLAIGAAQQALDASGLGAIADGTGVAIGLSGATQYQNMRVTPDRRYPQSRISALYAARSKPHFQADVLARRFGLGGPRLAFGSASLGGMLALSHAMDLLRAGHAPAMLVGGGEINTLINALGMDALGVTAAGPCTPFSGPGGICFGEGAAFFVLETRVHAETRGAAILAELVATGLSADAYNDVAQDPSGRGLARAVGKSLDNSGVAPAQIGWVRTCGTGHRGLDAAEAIGLHSAFHGPPPPVNSTEPYFSHVNGVSPLLGLAAVVASLASGRAPTLPEAGALRPGPALTVLAADALPDGDCLLTATAFGGTNGAVIVRRPGPAVRVSANDGVITIAGMGAVSALGGTAGALLAGLAAPDTHIRLVDDAALRQTLPGIQLQRRERLVRMAMLAVAEALTGVPSGLSSRGSPRFGILVGLTRGPVAASEMFFEQALRGQFDITTGRLLLRTGRFSVASEIAHAFGLLGYSGTIAPGVHGGVHLLAHGAEILRGSPDLDGLLVVAADEWTGLMAALYGRLGLLGDGTAYEPDATGCVGGEGAAALLLCRRADAGGASGDLAIIAGTGFSGDTGIVPDPAGRAYQRAIAGAVGRAGVAANDIGFAIGQGCNWTLHDGRERTALRAVCPNTTLTSVLPRTGMAEAAGGLFGAIAATDALRGSPHGLLLGSTERGAHAALVLSRPLIRAA